MTRTWLAGLAGLALAAGLGLLGAAVLRPAPLPPPETVRVPGGVDRVRPAGEFRIGTRVVDAPVEVRAAAAIEVMVRHVSEADYARCMAEGACPEVPSAGRADHAQVGVSHTDATAYAVWLSMRTGLAWRLPTEAEWLRAAGDRGFDTALAPEASGTDPAVRWLAAYRREAERRGDADGVLHPLGHFGRNDRGVEDIAGNIWEWTATCFQNGTLTPDGAAVATRVEHCGVRVAQGLHRAFVVEFIRDARSGGCGAGVPPDYLGFRLVRDAA
jgi:formylglycine-generating enzyme required for sulfatase activity